MIRVEQIPFCPSGIKTLEKNQVDDSGHFWAFLRVQTSLNMYFYVVKKKCFAT